MEVTALWQSPDCLSCDLEEAFSGWGEGHVSASLLKETPPQGKTPR